MTKLVKKVVALLLVLSVMMGFVGCAFFDRIHATIDPKTDFISPQEIVRLLVNAIDDEKQMADTYASIPEDQRKDVSYSYYYEYLKILREFSYGGGSITGFRFLNDEENSRHLDSIYNKLAQKYEVDDYYTVFSGYGNVRTVVFEYDKDRSYNVYMYLIFDDDGYAYLSNDLISHVIFTYNYMQQYFNILTDGNADSITSLLSAEENVPDEYVDEVLSARSNYILDFYDKRVISKPEQFELIAANPFYVEYLIPEVFTADLDGRVSRKLSAFRIPDGTIKISDDFEQETSLEIATVNISSLQSIRCGLEYDYGAIYRLCGKPTSTYLKDTVVDVVYDKDGNPVDRKLLLVSYNGMNLTFAANYTDEKVWIGELLSIRIYSSAIDYTVCDIKVGDPEINIIKQFPMIEYGDYSITYNAGTVKFNLDYEIKDKKIKAIVISKAD